MPLDTAVPGHPGDVHGLATWVRSTLGTRLTETANHLHSASRAANSGWLGESGVAFRTRTARSAQSTDDLAATVIGSARTLDTVAVDLSRTQADMNEIRLAAAAAGLVVDGDVIMEPGTSPPVPGPPPVGPAATPESVGAHTAATAELDRWDRLMQAYRQADAAVVALREHQVSLLRSTWQNIVNDVMSKPVLVAGDMVGAGAAGLVAHKSSSLLAESTRLRAQSALAHSRATTAPAGTPRNTVYRDVDDARQFARQADDLDARATRLTKAGDAWGLKAGAALAVAGIVYDIVATDKPVGQAIVSGAAGFAASVGAGMAAGALVGTMVPIPVVGTVAGALVGTAAGLIASGAVDALYQHGIGAVDKAWEGGLNALGETGAAIGGMAEDAWDAIFS